MATKKEQADISQLQTDVALLKQFNSEVVKPGFEDIKTIQTNTLEAIKSLSYVPIKEFAEYKEEIDQKFNDLRKRTFIENTLSAIFGSLLTSLVLFVVYFFINGNGVR